MKNTLFTNDNLFILNGLNSEIADLIYLDPPFNSKRMYSAPVDSKAAGTSFKDMWTWHDVNDAYLETMIDEYPLLVDFISSIEKSHSKAMKAYILYMAQRLMELHRILKDTGSIYLHCDPTASHYLKQLMDFIFGSKNFRNEITWERSHQHNLASKKFDVVTDIILYYSKSEHFYFKTPSSELTKEEMEQKFPYIEEETGRRYTHEKLEQSSNKNLIGERIINGRRVISTVGWRWTQKTFDERLKENPNLIYWTANGKPRYKRYADEYEGRRTTNLWSDIKGLSSNSKERTGYPTQKPLALLKRIIESSSKVGDLVLDPFCGCATTCVAAQQSYRDWIGIDIEKQAVKILQERLQESEDLINTKVIQRFDVPQRTDIKYEPPSLPIKEKLFKKQNGHCNACDNEMRIVDFEIDHIIPKSKGGGDYIQNYQLLCGHCNKVKGNKPMQYLLSKLNKRKRALKNQIFGEEVEE